MSATFTPDAICEATYLPLVDDFQISPPIWWHSLAPEWASESNTGITGRQQNPTGDLEGQGVPKYQDTYLTGTGSRTGRAFDVLDGTVQDDWVSPWTKRYGLLFPDSTPDETWAVVDNATGASFKHALIILRMGVPANTAGTTPATDDCFAYLDLNYGATDKGYRLSFEYGQPIRLDYQDVAGGGAVTPVAVASDLGSVESYLAAHQNEIRLRIKPDTGRGLLVVEIGDGHYLRHSPARPLNPQSPNAPASLPSTERYRFYGQNRWATLEVYPLRYADAAVSKGSRYFGRPIPNIQAAQVIPNILGGATGAASGQVDSGLVYHDGFGNLSFETSHSPADAGDGLGGAIPAQASDVLVYIPPVWAVANIGPNLPEVILRTCYVQETQIWDDYARMKRTYGRIVALNTDGRYSGAFGNYACNITASNGVTGYAQRCRGIMGCGDDGYEIIRADPTNLVIIPYSDFSYKLTRELGAEYIFDGFSLFTALHLLLEIGQIAPKYRSTIPNPGFPPYADYATVLTLGKGTGLNPKYRFGPEVRVIDAIMALLQDSGLPISNPFGNSRSVPLYFGFDPDGQAFLIAYDPRNLPVRKIYSTYDPDGLGQIEGELRVFNSTAQMRTAVTVQGQDAWTYELLQYHAELPGNYAMVGFAWPAFLRNERYASEQYMSDITRTLAIQASLPTQVYQFRAPFDANVGVGQVVAIFDDKILRGWVYATVLRIDSTYGFDPETGRAFCTSHLTCRNVVNSIPF